MTSLLREIYEPKRIQLLIESLGIKELLLEITIPELKKQWVDSHRVTEKQFADVEEALGELGAAYVAWFLARSITDKLIDFNDLDIWANRLKVFKNNNKLMSIKDLGQVKTSSDLEKVANDVGDARIKNYAKAERAALGASRAGVSTGKRNVNDYLLGKCTTSKGSFDVYKIPPHRNDLFWLDKKLGMNARWCTAASPSYYRNYNDAPLYVFIGSGSEKYQMSIAHNEFKDKQDLEVDYAQKWVKEMYDWLIANDKDAGYSRSMQDVIDSEERIKVEYPEAEEQVKKALEGKNLEDTFSVHIPEFRTESFFRILCEKLNLPVRVYKKLLLKASLGSYSHKTNYPLELIHVKGGYLLAMRASNRHGLSPDLEELMDNNIAAALRQDEDLLTREIYPKLDEDGRRHLRVDLLPFLTPDIPSIADFKSKPLEGTKFQVLTIEKPSDVNMDPAEYFSKIVFELTGVNLYGSHFSDADKRSIIVVFFSDTSYIAAWLPRLTSNISSTARTNFKSFVTHISNRCIIQKNTGSAIWERPIEFYYSFWKPFIQYLGLNFTFKDIEAIKKYGHKEELIASRYSLPIPNKTIEDNTTFVYRVPSNRLDLPEMFEAPRVQEEGVLFGTPETFNGSGNIYFMRKRDGRLFCRTRNNNGDYWGNAHDRTAYKIATAIMDKYIKNEGKDENILQVPYSEAFLKTPEQREKERQAAAERQRKADERAARAAERAANREARAASREARAAERAAERAARPERQPRARQAQQEPQQTVVAPQQQQPQEYVPAADATPGTEYGPARIQYSTGQADLLRDAKVLEWEDGMQRLNPQQVARLESERGDLNTKVLLDRATGNIYVYFMDNRGVIVKRYTSSRNNLLVLNPEYMKRSNEQHRQELTPRQRQQLGLDEVKERVKPRRRESLLKDLATIKKDYMKGGPVVFKIGKLGEEED